MGTSIARKQLRDFLCLAIKYRNSLLRELENGPGDVSDASKIGFGGGFGRGYASRSILDLILGAMLRSKSSSDGTRSRVQRNISFQDQIGSDLEPF